MNNTRNGFNIILGIIALLVVGGAVCIYENTNHGNKEAPTTAADRSPLQHDFDLKNTPDYSISFSVKDCDDTICSGAGIVAIKDARSKALIQTINSDDLSFSKEALAKTSTKDTVLYDEQSPIIVGDFNFDGSADLAVRNGSNGGYGGPSYDIYLFDAANKKFTLSESLTKLATENLGMFSVDQNKKLITTHSKDGCCWHETDQYQVVNDQPVITYTLIEDASGATQKEGYMLITEKRLVSGKLVTTTKEVSQKEYYGTKENKLSEWVGSYEFDESTDQSPTETWVYKLSIAKDPSLKDIRLDIDGFQTMKRIKATATSVGDSVEIVFDSNSQEDLSNTYKKGDILFSLSPVSSGLQIDWKKMQPFLEKNKSSGIFSRISR